MRGVYEHFERNMLKYLRSRIFTLNQLVLPVAWLVFVGLALPTRFTDNYLEFIVPGIMIMTMVTTTFLGGSFLVFDNMMGFLNKFLALPTPRESILYGKIAYSVSKSALQAAVIITVAILMGATIFTPVTLAMTFLILLPFSLLFSTIGTTIALLMDDLDNFASVNAAITTPLFFTSTALMPYDSMPGWLRFIASINPLSFAIDNLRAAYAGSLPVTCILVFTTVATVTLILCRAVFRKVTLG